MKIFIQYGSPFTLKAELQAPDIPTGSLQPFIGSDIKITMNGAKLDLENVSYQQSGQFLTISDTRFRTLPEGEYTITIIGLRNAATFSAVAYDSIVVLHRGRRAPCPSIIHDLGTVVLNTPGTKGEGSVDIDTSIPADPSNAKVPSTKLLSTQLTTINSSISTLDTNVSTLNKNAGDITPQPVPQTTGTTTGLYTRVTLPKGAYNFTFTVTQAHASSGFKVGIYTSNALAGKVANIFVDTSKTYAVGDSVSFYAVVPQDISYFKTCNGNENAAILTSYSFTEAISPHSIVYIHNSSPIISQMTTADTHYIVRNSHSLDGATLTVPSNSTIEFLGGEISNGSIVYSNTLLLGDIRYNNISATGTVANVPVFPEYYGAIGNGIADDITAINNALIYNKCVTLKPTTYLTSNSIRVPSNRVFRGSGKQSVVYNTVHTGGGKNIILSEHIVPSRNVPGSPTARPEYEVTAISPNKNVVTCDTSAFQVGDAILFHEHIDDPAGLFFTQDFAIVKSIDTTNSQITLDNAITSSYLLALEHIYATNMSRDSEYYDTNHDIEVCDMTLKMKYPAVGSGMYGMEVDGYNINIHDIRMEDVTTPFGSNMFCRSVLENCELFFYGGVSDMAELQVNSKYRNLTYFRTGHNSNHQAEGFTINNGYGGIVSNCHIYNLDMSGSFRAINSSGILFKDCSFTSSCAERNDLSAFYLYSRNTSIDCINNSELPCTFSQTAYRCTHNGSSEYCVSSGTKPQIQCISKIACFNYADSAVAPASMIINGTAYNQIYFGNSHQSAFDYTFDMYLLKAEKQSLFEFSSTNQCSATLTIDDVSIGSITFTGNILIRLGVIHRKAGNAYIGVHTSNGDTISVEKTIPNFGASHTVKWSLSSDSHMLKTAYGWIKSSTI